MSGLNFFSMSGLSSYSITGLSTLSYFGLYTAYDKQTKKLKLGNLKDLVTFNRGLDWTLVEANKAISLSGLTVMMLSFLPALKKQSEQLLFQSISMLWTHSVGRSVVCCCCCRCCLLNVNLR